MVHITMNDDGQSIALDATWIESQQIKAIPGSMFKRNKWTMPLGWASLVMLRGVFNLSLTMSDDIKEWAWAERRNRVDPAMQLRTLLAPTTEFPCSGYDPRLYDFQQIGAEFLVTAGDALLSDEMGLGKTIQVLTALKRTGQLPALVICPNSVKDNWAKEIEMWFPEAFPVVISGTQTNKRKLFAESATRDNAIVIINIEAMRIHSRLAPYGSMAFRCCRECNPRHGEAGIRTSACEMHSKDLNNIDFKTVIVDEAHRIKDPKSKQTRACWAVMHQSSVVQRWALTGTPIAKHPGDLWSIMHGISPSEFSSRTKFIDRYCMTSWNQHGGLNIIGVNPEHRAEFDRFIEPRFRRTPKVLVLKQLPPKIRVRRFVQMSPKQRKAYNELNQQMLTWLGEEGNVLTVASNLARRVRLMQLASSYADVTYEDENDWRTSTVTLKDPSPKVDELLVILEELGDKSVVVAAEQRKLIELAAARLDKEHIPYVLITGAISQWERTRNLERFQNGDVRVLMFTIKAGGTGLTMTRADTIVFLQRSDSMVDNMQAEDRVHRIGSEIHSSVEVIDIITEDTVEVGQIRSISEKLDRLDEITKDRARLAEAGIDVTPYDLEISEIISSNAAVDDMKEHGVIRK